jgi:hypothetical protein
VCLAVVALIPWQSAISEPVYQWNGHYYALTSEETDWVSAEAEAASHGGHLITINNAQEQAFVEKTFLTPPDQVFWIGMTDAEEEGEWHWVSGEPVEYANWENPGEPNNVIWRHPVTGQAIDEDYGVINWHFVIEPPRRRSSTWNDILSVTNDDQIKGYRGIMEFATDPR